MIMMIFELRAKYKFRWRRAIDGYSMSDLDRQRKNSREIRNERDR